MTWGALINWQTFSHLLPKAHDTMAFFQFDARRVRSYIFRLPLCTRLLVVLTTAFYIASLTLPWFSQWAALIPKEINLGTSTSFAGDWLTRLTTVKCIDSIAFLLHTSVSSTIS